MLQENLFYFHNSIEKTSGLIAKWNKVPTAAYLLYNENKPIKLNSLQIEKIVNSPTHFPDVDIELGWVKYYSIEVPIKSTTTFYGRGGGTEDLSGVLSHGYYIVVWLENDKWHYSNLYYADTITTINLIFNETTPPYLQLLEKGLYGTSRKTKDLLVFWLTNKKIIKENQLISINSFKEAAEENLIYETILQPPYAKISLTKLPTELYADTATLTNNGTMIMPLHAQINIEKRRVKTYNSIFYKKVGETNGR